MPKDNKHYWDTLVEQVSAEIYSEADWLANALSNGTNSPFEQPVSEEQKRAYYEAQMYNESGKPNEAGRQQVMQRIGIQNYIPLLQELEKKRNGVVESGPPMSVDPELTGVDVGSY